MDLVQILSLSAGELIGVFTAAYALCALGLAMHFGYTGLLNFGQAGFAALGAYGYAVATLTSTGTCGVRSVSESLVPPRSR